MNVFSHEEWNASVAQLNLEAIVTEGLIVLWDKPTGWTSHDVVARVRATLREQFGKVKLKVGHAGTLDPLATGLLLLLLGKATKTQDQFMKLDKEYEVTGILGLVSDTYDVTGQIREPSIFEDDSARVTHEDLQMTLEKLLPKLVGQITQRVPAFSAVKRNGRKLYDMARKGQVEEKDLPLRHVEIYSLEVLEVGNKEMSFADLDSKERSYFQLRVRCSSGTYIRSLVHDIGQILGTGAVVSELRRTKVGEYSL